MRPPLTYAASQLVGLVLLCAHFVGAHSRFGCPKPRSANTNIKAGPCGGDAAGTPTTVLTPGLHTLKIEESIAHRGAPFKISLSLDGNDDQASACVLLDHIPANPNSKPTMGDASTYTAYFVTVRSALAFKGCGPGV